MHAGIREPIEIFHVGRQIVGEISSRNPTRPADEPRALDGFNCAPSIYANQFRANRYLLFTDPIEIQDLVFVIAYAGRHNSPVNACKAVFPAISREKFLMTRSSDPGFAFFILPNVASC